MADPVDGGLKFILEAIKVSPVAVLAVPMGLGLILVVAEQVRKEPRSKMLNTIWIYLGICVFLAVMSVGYSWLNPSSKQKAALEYAVEALDRQENIYAEYVRDGRIQIYSVSPEVKVAWNRTEDALRKVAEEACKNRLVLRKKIAEIDGAKFEEVDCSSYETIRRSRL